MEQKNNDTLTKLRIAAVIALAAVLLTLVIKTAISSDRREIKSNMSMPKPPDSSSAANKDLDLIDKQRLISQYIYAELISDEADRVTLSMGGVEAGAGELLPVYNALFSPDGLQIASLADSRLTCNKLVVDPLSKLLNAFYGETGLRTIMIISAYEPTEQPEPIGYYDEYGYYNEYYPESDAPEETASGLCIRLGIYDENLGRLDFTGEGDYSWFSQNAYKYGFVLRYPAEKQGVTDMPFDPSLYRYVGKEAAAVMHEYSLCLEEFGGFMFDKGFENSLLVLVDETPRLIYSLPDNGLYSAQIQLPSSADGAAAPYCAYGIERLFIICAEPRAIPYSESRPDNRPQQ